MKLAAVGSNCIDYYTNIGGGTGYPGGGPVNMAVYTVRLGGQASYIGPVGDDAGGEMMRQAIARKDGERVFGDYDEGVLAEYSLSDADLDFISTHDMVICDLWGKVEHQFEALKARGMKTAFDCATRPEDPSAQTAIPHTDYLFFSSDNGDTPELRETIRTIWEKGPKLVTAMLGVDGSLCFDGSEFHRFGIVPCENVVDSMGAGDSYIAGFLYALQDGNPILECMRSGAACATETLGYFGGW